MIISYQYQRTLFVQRIQRKYVWVFFIKVPGKRERILYLFLVSLRTCIVYIYVYMYVNTHVRVSVYVYLCVRVLFVREHALYVGVTKVNNCLSEARDDVWLGSGGGDLGQSHVDGNAIVVQRRRLEYDSRRTDDHG